MKNIAILGASGQLGLYIRKNLSSTFKITPFSRQDLDITNEIKLIDNLKGFDFVINAAAFTDIIGAETKKAKNLEINYKAVKKIIKICNQMNIHLIHISSNYVFTPTSNKNNYVEEDLTSAKPLLQYGIAKLKADQIIIKQCYKYTIIRSTWLHAGIKHNFISKMLGFKQKNMTIADDDLGNLTTGNMVVRFLQKIISNNIVGDFNLCTDEVVSRYELFKLFIEMSNKEIKLKKGLMRDFGLQLKYYQNLTMDNSKAKKIVKINSIKEELKIWYLENKECL